MEDSAMGSGHELHMVNQQVWVAISSCDHLCWCTGQDGLIHLAWALPGENHEYTQEYNVVGQQIWDGKVES